MMDSNFGGYKHHTDSYIAKTIYKKDQNEVFSKSKMVEFEDYLMENINQYHIEEIAGAKKII